jgi:pSer/pThr/pTyr-binding forkhead associated (FHA) protein
MEVSITTLTRRKNGSIGRKEEVKACETLRIGRGAENEIFLLDARVPLHLAALHDGADGLFIEATGSNDLRLNNSIVRKAHVNVGDIIGIGPYDLGVVEPTDGINIAVTLELVQPIGDDV